VGPRPTPSPDRARRAELADFLKARRAALDPAKAGVPTGGFRRTPGLRREEVAQRAGVGLSWYTWLEQARDVTPSAQVLGALSRALELTGPDTAHLFRLAGVAEPGPSADATDDATLGEDVVAIVHELAPHPALGRLNLLQSQTTLSDDPRLRLRILVPADAATRRVLESACE